MTIVRKSTIDDIRYMLVFLPTEEMIAFFSVESTVESRDKWWFEKLTAMGCWVTKILTVHQVKEGEEWKNSFKVSYK